MHAGAKKPPSPPLRRFAAHKRIVDSLGIPAAVLSLDGTLLHANERLAMLLQAPRQELPGTRLDRWVVPEDRRRYRRLLGTTSLAAMVITDLGLMQQDGAIAHVQLQFGPRRIGTEEALLLTVFDVTAYRVAVNTLEGERAGLEAALATVNQELLRSVVRQHEEIEQRERAETRLTAALADKDALLREIHHRVKNNLQVLCDLLYLQAEGTASPEAETVLRDARGRIFVMARLHEHLHQAMHGGRVALLEYLSRLAEGFKSLYPAIPVRVEANVSDITVDLDRAVHVGLIVNELVTNALKHGFPRRQGGEVVVGLHLAGEQIELQVRDNGSGLPADLDLEQGQTLGLRIVHILARRLNAAVMVESTPGTTFAITFPLHADAPVEPRHE